MTIRHRNDAVMRHQLSELASAIPEIVTTATLVVETSGQGFTEIYLAEHRALRCRREVVLQFIGTHR